MIMRLKIITGVVVVLCFVTVIVLLIRQNAFTDNPDVHPSDQNGHEESHEATNEGDGVEIIEGLIVTSDYRLEKIPNPVEWIVENPDEARERFELSFVERVFENKNTDTYPTFYFYDYIDKIPYRISRRTPAPAPLNAPRMLMLFREPGPDGDMIPCEIAEIDIRALESDDGLLMSRRLSPREIYSQDVTMRYPTKLYSDYLYNKWTDEYNPEEHGPYAMPGSYGISVLLSESAPLEYDSLIMGELYGFSFRAPYEDGGGEEGHIILRMPESVPKGITAVFEIDVTQIQDYNELLNKRSQERFQSRTVKVHFYDTSITRSGYYIGFQTEHPDGRVFFDRTYLVTGKGYAKRIDELGGRFIISNDNLRMSYMIYLIEQLESRDIKFPRDADIVVDLENLISFNMEVPYNMLPDNALFLCLLLEKGSPLYVSSSFFGFGRVSEIDSRYKEGYQPDSVPMKSLPGEYYVAAQGFEVSEIIGRVVIRKEDEGKTLRILPLE